jgi:hypothetical protein
VAGSPTTLTPDHDLTLEADVADRQRRRRCHQRQILSAAGYKVLLIEEGPLKTSSDFKLLETRPTPASIRKAWAA